MELAYLDGVIEELEVLPATEQVAILNALDKLELVGDQLGAPHTSKVQGTNLRELRPRAGRSPWRIFYERIGDTMVIAAISPEALHNKRGFNRAIELANRRLAQYRATR